MALSKPGSIMDQYAENKNWQITFMKFFHIGSEYDISNSTGPDPTSETDGRT
jgi:hypothetical protein